MGRRGRRDVHSQLKDKYGTKIPIIYKYSFGPGQTPLLNACDRFVVQTILNARAPTTSLLLRWRMVRSLEWTLDRGHRSASTLKVNS